MYHAIGSPALGDRLGIFTLSPHLFAQHIAILSEFGNAIPLGQPGFPSGPPLSVAVTFDDGYADNLHVAAPILEKYSMPFTLFVSAAFVRNHTRHFLCPSELRDIANHPLANIGSHGNTHIPLTECSEKKLREEVKDSKYYLEDTIGKEITVLSYPYGAVNRRVRNVVEETGYRSAACSYFNINGPTRDPFFLGRTTILRDDSPQIFRQKLHGDWDWYRLRQHDPEKS